jgi:hypothetical protein
MSRYGAGVTRAGINTADTAWFNLVGGTGDRLQVREVKVNIAVAPTTPPVFYLARTTARGTQASTLLGQNFDLADAPTIGTLDVTGTGGSQPTFTAASRIDIQGMPVTAGGTLVFPFYDDPIVIPATAAAGLALCNAVASGATTGTFYCSMIWD